MEQSLDSLPEIDLLYKYYSFTKSRQDYVRQVLAENKVYFPTPAKFNDPFDSKIRPCFEGSEAEWKTWLTGALERNCPQMDRTQRLQAVRRAVSEERFSHIPDWVGLSHLDKIGVFCMSKRCDHLLMWSHYAQSHEGLCMAFNANSDFFGRSQKIEYSELYPRIRYLDASKEKLTEATLLTKAAVWKYEEEWRVIEYKRGPGAYIFPSELLVAVILGHRMPPGSKHLIYGWCSQRQPRPRVFQTQLAKDAFRLELRDITSIAHQ